MSGVAVEALRLESSHEDDADRSPYAANKKKEAEAAGAAIKK